MHSLTKAVVLVLLGVAVILAAATGRQRNAADPDLLGPAAAAGAHTDPVPAGYGPSTAGIPRLVAIGAGECIPCKAMAERELGRREGYIAKADILMTLSRWGVTLRPTAG
jgi:hypothetical protein